MGRIEAERAWLQQQRLVLQADGDRARATVDLIRALGGGWGDDTQVADALASTGP